MNKFCKFCGKPIKTAKYLNDFEKSCGECTIHCMKKCKKIMETMTNWHCEPCVSCQHNPYRNNYIWNGEKWIKFEGDGINVLTKAGKYFTRTTY